MLLKDEGAETGRPCGRKVGSHGNLREYVELHMLGGTLSLLN